MLSEMSSQQLFGWMAYNQIEPFGAQGDDLRMAYILTLYLNSLRTKDDKPFEIADVYPGWGVLVKPKQSPKQMQQFAKLMAAGGLGKIA